MLATAKFIAGAITAICFFGASILLTFAGMYLHFPNFQIGDFLLNGPGLGTTGCLRGNYGAGVPWLGLGVSLDGDPLSKSVVPAVEFFAWESINVFLPSLSAPAERLQSPAIR